MKEPFRNPEIKRSILILALASFLQPYFVLITHYGRSNECWNCPIIAQTFLPSLIYLFLPLTVFFWVMNKTGVNSYIRAFLLTIYFVPVSFVKLTIPLFDDRIAAWSTFSEQEIWNTALFLSTPSMVIVSSAMIVILGWINRKPAQKKQIDVLDDLNDGPREKDAF